MVNSSRCSMPLRQSTVAVQPSQFQGQTLLFLLLRRALLQSFKMFVPLEKSSKWMIIWLSLLRDSRPTQECWLTKQDLNARALDSHTKILQALSTLLVSSPRHNRSTPKKEVSDHSASPLSSLDSKMENPKSSKQNLQEHSLNGKQMPSAKSLRNFANSSKKTSKKASLKRNAFVSVSKPFLKLSKVRKASNS